MNTGDLKVYKWLIIQHPNIVAEYSQYYDAAPFQPLQLQCTVNNLDKIELMYGRLTAIVRYWIRYYQGGKPVVLLFGMGKDFTVNSTIVLPTLRQ